MKEMWQWKECATVCGNGMCHYAIVTFRPLSYSIRHKNRFPPRSFSPVSHDFRHTGMTPSRFLWLFYHMQRFPCRSFLPPEEF